MSNEMCLALEIGMTALLPTPEGYFGLIDGKWQMFTTEEEYIEAFEEYVKKKKGE